MDKPPITTIAEENTPDTTPVVPRRHSRPHKNDQVDGNEKTADEKLAERRKSLVPMSSMEEENLRERLHMAQLRQCFAIISNEVRYTKDTFRRLFQSQVSQ